MGMAHLIHEENDSNYEQVSSTKKDRHEQMNPQIPWFSASKIDTEREAAHETHRAD